MDLSVQIDLTLVVQFISLLIFCVWGSINLTRFDAVKIWTFRRNYSGSAIASRDAFPTAVQRCQDGNPALQIVAEQDWLQPLVFKHPTWQATRLTLEALSGCNPPPRVLPPAVFLLMLLDISFVMIHTQSRFQERRPWRRLGSTEPESARRWRIDWCSDGWNSLTLHSHHF